MDNPELKRDAGRLFHKIVLDVMDSKTISELYVRATIEAFEKFKTDEDFQLDDTQHHVQKRRRLENPPDRECLTQELQVALQTFLRLPVMQTLIEEYFFREDVIARIQQRQDRLREANPTETC